SEYCKTVTIQPTCNLKAHFYYYIDSTNPNVGVYRFVNSSIGNGFDSSFWNFGDGSVSHDKNATHIFAVPGTYTVCLYIKQATVVSGTINCVSSICKTIVVTAECNIEPNFTWKLDSTAINFTNTSLASSVAT